MTTKNINVQTNVQAQIYMINNIKNNKKYIGQTIYIKNDKKYSKQGYLYRWKEHVIDSKQSRNSKNEFYKAIREDGENSFTVQLLCTCDLNLGNYFENLMMKEFNTLIPNGYNTKINGTSIEKLSQAATIAWGKPEIRNKYSVSHTSKNDLKKIKDFSETDKITEIEITRFHFSYIGIDGIRCHIRDDNRNVENEPSSIRMEFCNRKKKDKEGKDIHTNEEHFKLIQERARFVCNEINKNHGGTLRIIDNSDIPPTEDNKVKSNTPKKSTKTNTPKKKN